MRRSRPASRWIFGVPVLVVGDVMLDRHVHGHVRRISPEAPVPVVSLAREMHTPGRCGQRRRDAGRPGLPGDPGRPGGRRRRGAQLREALHAKGVDRLALHEGPGLQTISKTRILSDSQQQLLRLDRDGDRAAFAAAAEALLERVLPLVDRQAAVVLADYEKGVITARPPGRSSTAAGSGASPAWSTPRRPTSPPMPGRPS